MTIDPLRRGAIALGAALALSAVIPLAAHAGDAEDIAAAVEKLRAAMLAGDGAVLDSLTDDKLSYGHSNGRTETKAEFVASLAGKNSFKSLELTRHVVEVSGDNAIARHVFDSVNNLPDGKTSTAYITVLQVWKKSGGAWKLFARQSAPIQRG